MERKDPLGEKDCPLLEIMAEHRTGAWDETKVFFSMSPFGVCPSHLLIYNVRSEIALLNLCPQFFKSKELT